ncbi:hypothetical protein [Gordonia sp. SL306]|uniref:hypothetical protein n=1 Tax=Gordonia sp. SL306 TaxID=2995145 RepID=UPI002271095E|nr:hypothetical protein [Gordonia sp. SL306]WAC57594.1 hypothetical protein OVA31_10345 [Gordonia sp. SL306]
MSDLELTPEYRDALRDVAGDPSLAGELRRVLDDLNQGELRDELFPMPTRWAPDNYALFLDDDRVMQAEFQRRVRSAVDDWHARNVDRISRLPPDDWDRIVEWTGKQFRAELSGWSQRQGGSVGSR